MVIIALIVIYKVAIKILPSHNIIATVTTVTTIATVTIVIAVAAIIAIIIKAAGV